MLLIGDRSPYVILFSWAFSWVGSLGEERGSEDTTCERVSLFSRQETRLVRYACCKRTVCARYAPPFWSFSQNPNMDRLVVLEAIMHPRHSFTMGDVQGPRPHPSRAEFFARPSRPHAFTKLQYYLALVLVTRQWTWARARAQKDEKLYSKGYAACACPVLVCLEAQITLYPTL